jgi:hypothetical protein
MAIFTDTVTIYQKQTIAGAASWLRTVISGVQWAEKTNKTNVNGKISVAKYISITFPQGTYESLDLTIYGDEDAIVYGTVDDVVTEERGHRISDLLKAHKGGIIQSANDNSNRDYLKNIKVVLG